MSPRWHLSLPGALGILLLLAASTARADDAAIGRRHAQRASHLAAAGKCKQAVMEYDKAIAVLRDPALLFNRAECHRKLGDTDAALADYNQFLNDLPSAPNRAQVQARMAALRKAPAVAAPPAPLLVDPVPDPLATPPPARDPRKLSSPALAPPPPLRPQSSGAAAGAPSPSTSTGHGAGALPEIPASAGGDVADDNVWSDSLLDAPADSSRSSSRQPGKSTDRSDIPLVKNPWFWTAIGAVVLGAGVATFVVLRRDGTAIPSSDLGNYRF